MNVIERKADMKHIHFKPWVGDNYQNGGDLGKRILVLGESHYQWDEDISLDHEPNLTIDCVTSQISDNGRYPRETQAFWTNIVIAFLNRHPSDEDKYKFWHSVAFFNTIQESVGCRARVRPNDPMWEKGRLAFREVVSKYCPQFIAVLGYEHWNNLPEFDSGTGPTITDGNGNKEQTGYYDHCRGRALAFRLMHPSSGGFSSWNWHSPLMRALRSSPNA